MKHYPLPKSVLLRKNREYHYVFQNGKRLRGDHFSLIFTPNGKTTNRLGISVHGIKGAVKRNRIKRIIREFYRLHQTLPFQEEGGTKPAVDVVFAVRNGFKPDSPREVAQAIFSLMSRADTIRH